MSSMTTELAPTTTLLPIVTPGRTTDKTHMRSHPEIAPDLDAVTSLDVTSLAPPWKAPPSKIDIVSVQDPAREVDGPRDPAVEADDLLHKEDACQHMKGIGTVEIPIKQP